MNLRFAHLRQETAALLPGSSVRRARATYFITAEQTADVFDRLDEARYSTTRARLLSNLAALHSGMAREYAAGWRTSPVDQEITAEYEISAALLHALAGTEAAESPEFRAHSTREGWEEAFGQALDDITSEPLAGRRAELMTRLYLAAHPIIGAAAETIARVGTSYVRIALRAAAADTVDARHAEAKREVTLVSFGHHHGEPPAADHVEDLRPFRDPNVSPQFRHLTAGDQAVIDTVLATPGIRDVISNLADKAHNLTARGQTATIAVGCAGGRHRAPTVVNTLAEVLAGNGYTVQVQHRDLRAPVVPTAGEATNR